MRKVFDKEFLISIIVVLLVLGLVLSSSTSCAYEANNGEAPSPILLERSPAVWYSYDETHDVCIWMWNNSIAVLPARDVKNPRLTK